MKWKDIAVVSGKQGMYRVFKPTRSGMILEAIAKKKTKLVINSSYRVSILQEISLYTLDNEEGSVPIAEVFYRIHDKHGLKLEIKKDAQTLTDFIADILPDYDPKRVYVSDMKKVVSWYQILAEFLPEMLERKEEEATEETTKEEENKEEKA